MSLSGKKWLGTAAAACVLVTLVSGNEGVRAAGNNWYVSATGTGSGTQASPMSLTKALSSTSPAQPGDTIWLRGGTYTGAYSSQLTGTAAAPIVVRGYAGERATLDANNAAARAAGVALAVGGAHVVFRDFEVTSSDAGRTDQNVGYGNFPGGIDINQSQDIKLVNLVIHDLPGKGVGAWAENTTAEIYGCLIYYNGMSDHDHGIYVQNQVGTKRLADNIIFDQASHGIHGYASSDGYLDNITIEGNTVFDNGGLLGESSRNILLGGGRVAQNPVVRANYTYLRGSLSNSNIGYTAGTANAVVQDNYWVAGNAAVRFTLDAGAVVTGNFFAGPLDPADTATRWPANSFKAAKPTTGQTVFVRPNQYEAGRATITVYNWAKTASVAVNLSTAGLTLGDSFELRDALNFYGAPVLTGLYTGATVTVPMTGLIAALPVGAALTPPTHPAPTFGAFVLLKTAAGSGGGDTMPPSVAVTAPAAGETIGGTATLAASASDDTGVAGVQFRVDDANVGVEVVSAPFAFKWDTSGTTDGAHTVTAVARDAAGNQATSAAVSVTVSNTGSTPASTPAGSAAFVRTDATTQGNWESAYGADGYAVVGDLTSLPSGVQMAASGQSNYTWAASSADGRALQKASGPDRVMAAWYAQAFELDLTVAGTQARQVAIYSADFDALGRQQRFDVLDGGTGAVLGSRTLTAFTGGQYAVWSVLGHVRIRVTSLARPNAVVSGVFFGGPGSSSSVASAVFLKSDVTTQGTWQGLYGSRGHVIAADGTSLPPEAAVTISGQATYTWATSTSDVRALERESSGRVMAAWYAGTFTIDVTITGVQPRQVAIHAADFDLWGRRQRVDVVDAGTGTVLDTRTIADFSGGQYLAWNVQGHVLIRVTQLAGPNAVISGIFVD